MHIYARDVCVCVRVCALPTVLVAACTFECE